jgi:hypothetical protein
MAADMSQKKETLSTFLLATAQTLEIGDVIKMNSLN